MDVKLLSYSVVAVVVVVVVVAVPLDDTMHRHLLSANIEAIYRMKLTRQPLGLRATRQPLGGHKVAPPPLLLRRYRRNAKR